MAAGAWRRAAANLLDVLKDMDLGQIFAKPVNQLVYLDYGRYVQTPMDLGTVRARSASYPNAKAFAADVKLVFSNALAYCGRIDATPDFKAVATLAKKMTRRFDKDSALRPYLVPTPLRNRTPPPVDEDLAAQIASNDGKVAMTRDVETCISRVHQSLKRVKAAQNFRSPIEVERWTDYEPKVGGKALDLTTIEAHFKRGSYTRDTGKWVLNCRRIASNCLRYNTDPRFPELRNDAKFYLKALEKELLMKVRPVLVSVGCPASAIDTVVPKLLRNWDKVLEALESSILSAYDDTVVKAQTAYYFLHPFAAYFPSADQQDFVEDYAKHVSTPICVGDVVSRLIEGTYGSLEPLKKDVDQVFANAIRYYGENGAGRQLHAPSDCDDYVARARRFDAAWKTAAQALKNAGREVKSPTSRNETNEAGMRVLAKLRAHREADGAGGTYQVATPFLHANMLPTHQEYLSCVGGRKNCRDFDSAEMKCKRQGFGSLDAVGNDVRRCFQNAHAWRTRCDDLVRVGSMDANTLAIAAEITNSADILLIVLDKAMKEESTPFVPIKREASPARLTTPKRAKADPSPTRPLWRVQADRLWSKVTRHEWVRNDGLQSFGGKLQWFRPTVEAFPTLREHYLGVVAKPMDLGYIDRKLTEDGYEHRSEFVEDLKLVFTNAVEFNRPAAAAATTQQSLNPHFVMDDLAAKTFAIAQHLRDYVDHLDVEYFKDDILDLAPIPFTASSITRNGISRDSYTCVLDEDEEAACIRREEAQAEAAKLNANEAASLSAAQLRAAMDGASAPAAAAGAAPTDAAAEAPAPADAAAKAPAPADAAKAPADAADAIMKRLGASEGNKTIVPLANTKFALGRAEAPAPADATGAPADAPAPATTPPAEDDDDDDENVAALRRKRQKAASPGPLSTMDARLKALDEGRDEARDRRAKKRLDCRRGRDRAVWPSRVRDPDADRECRTVLKQLRKLAVKKHSFYFEKMVKGVPDYAAFVARPTCLERVEKRIKLGCGEIARALDEDYNEPVVPYKEAREFGNELRLVLTNAKSYNERFRNNPHNVGSNICLAVDAVEPVLEEALFHFAFEAYERVQRAKIENSWEKVTAEEMNVEAAERRVVREQHEEIARRRLEASQAHLKWATREKREWLIRRLNDRQRENLDILEAAPGDLQRPPSPFRLQTSEADVTPAKIMPVSRLSAAVRAGDRQKAEQRRAQAVFVVLGGNDAPWAQASVDVEMAIEAPVVAASAPAPVKATGAVKFEIRRARAARPRPALDAFRDFEDSVEAPPPRPPPKARPVPVAVEPVEPAVIECSSGDSGWVRVADGIEARVFLATTASFVRARVVLRGGSSATRRALVSWSLVRKEGVDEVTAGFYRDALLRDARYRRRARACAGADAIRAARPARRTLTALDAELLELDLRDAGDGRVLVTRVEDTVRGALACSEGALVFAVMSVVVRVAGRRVVCAGLLS